MGLYSPIVWWSFTCFPVASDNPRKRAPVGVPFTASSSKARWRSPAALSAAAHSGVRCIPAFTRSGGLERSGGPERARVGCAVVEPTAVGHGPLPHPELRLHFRLGGRTGILGFRI